jgi:hypothetical protein
MTAPRNHKAASRASGVPKGARVPPVTCEACKRPYSTREQWTFTGRETHWGFTFLVWTRADGKRWPVRVW